MFQYNCNEAHLINWLLSQNKNQVQCLFPKNKGWKSELHIYYPTSEQPFLAIHFQHEEDEILFIPIDSGTHPDFLANITPPKLAKFFPKNSGQICYITSEKAASLIQKQWVKKMKNSALMVLFAQKVEFMFGEFENAKFEYRLNKTVVDSELTSQRVPSVSSKDLYGNSVIPFYQRIFHRINYAFVAGEKKLLLEQVVQDASIYWPLLHKKDKKLIQESVLRSFQHLQGRYFQGMLRIEESKKKQQSQPNWWIILEGNLNQRKEAQLYARAQGHALSWLRHENQQILITGDEELSELDSGSH